jgi:hypothetical protein
MSTFGEWNKLEAGGEMLGYATLEYSTEVVLTLSIYLADAWTRSSQAADGIMPGLNPRGRVNKDLVIWPEPGMTMWDLGWNPINVPAAVLEWKSSVLSTEHPSYRPTTSLG